MTSNDPHSTRAIASIRVQPVTQALAAGVRALQVTSEQREYVGDAAFNLAQAQADPLSEAMARVGCGSFEVTQRS